MSYFNQGKSGAANEARTNKYMKGAGYARGGRVKANEGDTHISINIGDDSKIKAPGAAPGAQGSAMADEDKKKAFAAGMAAAAQAATPPMPPPGAGGPPGGAPGMLPPGGGGPGMKRGGRVSKAKTVVGPGVTEPKKPKVTTTKPFGGDVKGGSSQAAKTWGPPINNKKNGGGVIQPGFKGGGGGSGVGRLEKTADEKRSN